MHEGGSQMGIQIGLNHMSDHEKLMIYTQLRKDILNEKAIFSDETRNFRNPVEPEGMEPTLVKLRTAFSNVDEAFICFDGQRVPMTKTSTEEIFDYYEGMIPPRRHTIHYFFEIQKDGESYFYNKKGIGKDVDHVFNFRIIPDFKTPDWAKGAVMYQIFVDRFFNGDHENDVVTKEYTYLGKMASKVEDWHKYPATDGICEFYGGDLKGVMDKLEYLSNLGIEVIYFNPIFVSPSNHKYDIQDYDYIDPHYGVIIEDGGEPLTEGKYHNRHASMYVQRTTSRANLQASNDLMIALIQLAHNYGIKVILDGVFNHSGAFNKWLDREGLYGGQPGYPPGAYREKHSPYHNYFHWYDFHNWPNNDCYDGWWGYDNHPKLNFEGSRELYEYILEIGRKWVSPPYNADGWRLDVAADLGYSKEFNHQFWRDFRKAVKEANSHAIILAEHYGDAYDWLQGDQWDTVMNYDAFMEPITWFLTGMEKHSDEYRGDLLGNGKAFEDAMRYHMSRFSIQSLQVAMNELSNHDHSRFFTRTNMTVGRTHTKGPEAAAYGIDKGIMKEAVVIQMTWVGAPTIYYGDEAGAVGWTDPDNRRTYPWGREDQELIAFHKEMICIHKSYDAIKTGSLEILIAKDGILSYGRWDEKDKLIIAVNNNNKERQIMIPTWRIGVRAEATMIRMISTDVHSFFTEPKEYLVSDGQMMIKLPARGSIVLREKDA